MGKQKYHPYLKQKGNVEQAEFVEDADVITAFDKSFENFLLNHSSSTYF